MENAAAACPEGKLVLVPEGDTWLSNSDLFAFAGDRLTRSRGVAFDKS